MACERRVELHGAADKVAGIKQPEHDRGIGDCRLAAAKAVASGTGIGAGRLWSDAQAATAVDPGERSATSAECGDIEHRYAHLIAGDLRLRFHEDAALVDQRYVARRAADVDGDEIVETGLATGGLAADGTSCRTGEKQPDWTLPRDLAAGETATGLHDLQGCGNAGFCEIAVQVGEVPCDHRFHIGIEGGNNGALILAEHRIDLTRDGNRDTGHGGF